MMKINKLTKIAVPLIVTGLMGLGAHAMNKGIESNGGKTMPRVQPCVWVYDTDKDGNPDKTIIGLKREPTKEEINWYNNQK